MDHRDSSIIEAAWTVADRIADEGTDHQAEAAEAARAALGALLDALAADPVAGVPANEPDPQPQALPVNGPTWARAIWEGGSAVPS